MTSGPTTQPAPTQTQPPTYVPPPTTPEDLAAVEDGISPWTVALIIALLAGDEEEANRASLNLAPALAAAVFRAFTPNRRPSRRTTDKVAQDLTSEARSVVDQYRRSNPEGQNPAKDADFVESFSNQLAQVAQSQAMLGTLKHLDPGGSLFKKMWLTRGDSKVRHTHRELHGKAVGLTEDFKTGLGFPGDPAAPLDETINCRCFMWPVPSSDAMADEVANAFEPADLDTSFAVAASALVAEGVVRRTLARLLRAQPWLWQPRDRDGRWIEVGDIIYAPEPPGPDGRPRKTDHRVRVTQVTGRDRVGVQSIDFPNRKWEVDSRDTTPDASKARLPYDQPRFPLREVRKPVVDLESQDVGAPIFETNEVEVGDVVAFEERPGIYRYMVVEHFYDEINSVLLKFPPQSKFRRAGFEDEFIFELEDTPSLMPVELDEGRVFTATNQDSIDEVRNRFMALEYGFANPARYSTTQGAFKIGPMHTDWVPARKALHDKIVQDAFDRARQDPQPTYYMTGGGPASGKSTMLSSPLVSIPEGDGAIQVNADDIKELIPEYQGLREADSRRASTFVHEESSQVSGRMIYESPEGYSIVLDGVGDKGYHSVEKRLEVPKSRGMRTVGHYATLPTDMAVQLADARFRQPGPGGGRYVPEDYVRSAHADVTDTFFDLVKRGSLDELHLWNTELYDAEKKQGIPRPIFSYVDGESTIHDHALLIEFLQKSRTRRHKYEDIVLLTDQPVNPEMVPEAGMEVAVAAAGEIDILALLDTFDWDTKNVILAEAMAELSGASFESRLPDALEIRLIKDSLIGEAIDHGEGAIVDPINEVWDEPDPLWVSDGTS